MMTKPSPWIAYYEVLPGGQCRMRESNLDALEIAHPDRVFFADLSGHTERVALLDRPFRIAEEFAGMVAYRLRRIRLRELPGWPPKLASSGHARALPPLMDCRLSEATYSPGTGPGQEAVELLLEHLGRNFRGWLAGRPASLLKCVEATMNQDHVVGMKLMDIQDLRLIGAEI